MEKHFKSCEMVNSIKLIWIECQTDTACHTGSSIPAGNTSLVRVSVERLTVAKQNQPPSKASRETLIWMLHFHWFTYLMVKKKEKGKKNRIAQHQPARLPWSRLLEAFCGLPDNILWGCSHPLYHFFKTLSSGQKGPQQLKRSFHFSLSTYKRTTACIFSDKTSHFQRGIWSFLMPVKCGPSL